MITAPKSLCWRIFRFGNQQQTLDVSRDISHGSRSNNRNVTEDASRLSAPVGSLLTNGATSRRKTARRPPIVDYRLSSNERETGLNKQLRAFRNSQLHLALKHSAVLYQKSLNSAETETLNPSAISQMTLRRGSYFPFSTAAPASEGFPSWLCQLL